MILPVEPTTSAWSTTSIVHSGWTRILMPGYSLAELVDVLGLEHLVDAAMPLPQDHPAAADRLGRVAAESIFVRVPERHLLQRNAHAQGGVAAQVLIGEEQHAAAPREGPIEHGRGVGRGADDPAVPPAERLQVGRRVDVGDRHHVVRCRSPRPAAASSPRPGRSRPCRPSSSRRPGRAGPRAPAGRRARPAARAGWPGCRPSRP